MRVSDSIPVLNQVRSCGCGPGVWVGLPTLLRYNNSTAGVSGGIEFGCNICSSLQPSNQLSNGVEASLVSSKQTGQQPCGEFNSIIVIKEADNRW